MPVFLDLDFDKAFAENRVGAYERLLMDAIGGRLNLFVRSDEQEQAWRWVEPILDAWSRENDAGGGYGALFKRTARQIGGDIAGLINAF